eukprot:CAMPEP_0171782362 /NCGR_PEP_ID=MMETSP0991-20121206/60799_1 /TAXON_ID=483369 /ORGANISM="non described non described, Strain CCMP2098" /LENGTH=111 /DNA_ID=CAMNT_0012390187 /DNA_START=80 /DNA_END=413 /DNA_ORIENTATION=+
MSSKNVTRTAREIGFSSWTLLPPPALLLLLLLPVLLLCPLPGVREANAACTVLEASSSLSLSASRHFNTALASENKAAGQLAALEVPFFFSLLLLLLLPLSGEKKKKKKKK